MSNRTRIGKIKGRGIGSNTHVGDKLENVANTTGSNNRDWQLGVDVLHQRTFNNHVNGNTVAQGGTLNVYSGRMPALAAAGQLLSGAGNLASGFGQGLMYTGAGVAVVTLAAGAVVAGIPMAWGYGMYKLVEATARGSLRLVDDLDQLYSRHELRNLMLQQIAVTGETTLNPELVDRLLFGRPESPGNKYIIDSLGDVLSQDPRTNDATIMIDPAEILATPGQYGIEGSTQKHNLLERIVRSLVGRQVGNPWLPGSESSYPLEATPEGKEVVVNSRMRPRIQDIEVHPISGTDSDRLAINARITPGQSRDTSYREVFSPSEQYKGVDLSDAAGPTGSDYARQRDDMKIRRIYGPNILAPSQSPSSALEYIAGQGYDPSSFILARRELDETEAYAVMDFQGKEHHARLMLMGSDDGSTSLGLVPDEYSLIVVECLPDRTSYSLVQAYDYARKKGDPILSRPNDLARTTTSLNEYMHRLGIFLES